MSPNHARPAFTGTDNALLAKIRADILAKPSAYRDGKTYLLAHFMPEQLSKQALDHRERLEADGQLDDFERARETHKLEYWTLKLCAGEAIYELLFAYRRDHGTHEDARALAVLIMAVLIWDKRAYTSHAVFKIFGDATLGRAAQPISAALLAGVEIFNKPLLREWMQMARTAWRVMSASIRPPAGGETTGDETTRGNTQPCWKRADQSRTRAKNSHDGPNLDTPTKMHEWLTKNADDDYDLPDFNTWTRYLRQFDAARDGLKGNQSRAGRTGRTVVPAEQI